MVDIVSVQPSDAGRYTCVADSGADRASDILELVGKCHALRYVFSSQEFFSR